MTTNEIRHGETQRRNLLGWLLILIATAAGWNCSWFRQSGSASGDQARPELALQLGHGGAVNDIAFSPDGKTLASGSDDETIRLWDAQTGELKRTLSGQGEEVTAIAFSPDGKLIASASGDLIWLIPDLSRNVKRKPVSEVKLWETETGKLVRTLTGHTDTVNAVVFSPDGRMIASSSGDKTVRLWNAATGELIRELKDHGGMVMRIAFSPDGSRLASANSDRTIRVWDAQTGALKQTLTGHEHGVFYALFSPNGKLIASCGADASVRLWEVSGGHLLATMMILPANRIDETSTEWIAFTPDGHYTGSTEARQFIRWRAGNALSPPDRFERDFNRAALVQQAIQSGR